MDTVPQIISTKDLAYLSDMFEWNHNAFKLVNHFMEEVEDERIKELFESIRSLHEEHMNFIIAILKKEDSYEEEYSEICECENCNCEMEDDNDEE